MKRTLILKNNFLNRVIVQHIFLWKFFEAVLVYLLKWRKLYIIFWYIFYLIIKVQHILYCDFVKFFHGIKFLQINFCTQYASENSFSYTYLHRILYTFNTTILIIWETYLKFFVHVKYVSKVLSIRNMWLKDVQCNILVFLFKLTTFCS